MTTIYDLVDEELNRAGVNCYQGNRDDIVLYIYEQDQDVGDGELTIESIQKCLVNVDVEDIKGLEKDFDVEKTFKLVW